VVCFGVALFLVIVASFPPLAFLMPWIRGLYIYNFAISKKKISDRSFKFFKYQIGPL
jgi:hypothetical protein